MGLKPSASRQLTIAATGTVTPLASPSPTRRAITISPSTVDIYVSDNPFMAAGEGLRVPFSQIRTELCACHLGDWVTKALYAMSQAGATACYVVEGFEPLWHEKESRTS